MLAWESLGSLKVNANHGIMLSWGLLGSPRIRGNIESCWPPTGCAMNQEHQHSLFEEKSMDPMRDHHGRKNKASTGTTKKMIASRRSCRWAGASSIRIKKP